jgi:hypothetical protein
MKRGVRFVLFGLLISTLGRQVDSYGLGNTNTTSTSRRRKTIDLTPANRIQTGSETERRNRGFFQTEATVGMD